MKQSTLIRAADFLYACSPAAHVTAQRDTLVVRGIRGSELADALFSLLFTTAFRPGGPVRLIRLMPAGAEEAELEFISRNEEGIGVFARHEYAEGSGKQPLSIRFLDDAAFDAESEKDRIAWAADLDGGLIPAGENRYTEKDIPKTAAEEESCGVLRIARRVHTAYTAGWNSRYTEEQISADLYGDADDEAYNLRSSLRLAVSIPWKLAAAGIRTQENNIPEKLYGKLSEPDGKIRDLLAWQEHRSWQAFMVLDRWRMPSEEELETCMFRDGNDYRSRKDKWHPCLCDLQEDDWNEPHEYSLKTTPIHEWSMVQASPDGYCLMDRMSLKIHHLCKQRVISEKYADSMHRLFRELEAALISAGAEMNGELISLARRMENMFRRLRENETNSYAPWRQACDGFSKALDGEENAGEIRRIFRSLRTEAAAAEERNRYRDYKEIDSEIIAWLPWILSEEKIRTVWKLYAPGNMLENILSAIILRPARLQILCAEEDAEDVPVEAFRRLLTEHGTGETSVLVSPLSALEEETVPVGPRDAADVTGCGEMQNRLRFPAGARIIYFANGDLQDKNGSAFLAPLYHPYNFALTVSEVFRLRGYRLLSDAGDNEMLGMEEDYAALWTVRQDSGTAAGDGRAWRHAIHALQEAEQANRRCIYRRCDSRRQPFSYHFPPADYEALVRSGAVHVLYELQKERCLGSLFVDPSGGEITCDIYPAPGERERYEETERNLTGMLADRREDSSYAVAGGYVQDGKPLSFLNLEDPLRINPDRIAAVLQNRYRNEENPPSALRIRTNIERVLGLLTENGLLIPAGERGVYRYKSLPVRRELEQEGFALEAYVYYTLFLSGQFDDVRSNVRVWDGKSAAANDLERELDILVTRKGRVGLISCKDTAAFTLTHIGEIRMQAEMYAINASPILVCPKKPDEDRVKLCRYLRVGLIRGKNVETSLVNDVIRMMG